MICALNHDRVVESRFMVSGAEKGRAAHAVPVVACGSGVGSRLSSGAQLPVALGDGLEGAHDGVGETGPFQATMPATDVPPGSRPRR